MALSASISVSSSLVFELSSLPQSASGSSWFGMIDNGNRTEWSPYTSDEQEWITVKQESDLSITSMIMDKIRQHKVLLPINHSCYNFQKQQIHLWQICTVETMSK